MRSEQEMMNIIMGMAQEDVRIRAVIMNGSRANPAAPRDMFQDYDIVYVVTSVNDFVQEQSWIKTFGELIIMQTPDDMDLLPRSEDRSYGFLMLFADGNRIDLTLYPAETADQMESERLSILLLDKDGVFESFPPPSIQDYIITPPTAKTFADCCNEFWWVCTYIAKGLWRRELTYAKFHQDGPVRDMLHLMLQWDIGIQSGYTADPGKMGKYYEQTLNPDDWELFKKTYSDAKEENIWRSLFVMCNLFRRTAVKVALSCGFQYNHEEDRKVSAYLEHIQTLPKNAKAVY